MTDIVNESIRKGARKDINMIATNQGDRIIELTTAAEVILLSRSFLCIILLIY